MSKPTGTIERRFVAQDDAKAEFRASEGDQPNVVKGYASVFNAKYETQYFVETVKPGAFSRALKEKQDVRSLIDHIPTFVLGRTKSNTLVLTEDDRGLLTDTKLPDTSYANDLKVKMSRGDVDGMSFGFVVKDETWGQRDGKLYREILDVDLFDVSVVTYPAYPATSANLRSQTEVLEAGKKFIEEHRDQTQDATLWLTELEKYIATLERM